MQLMRKQPSFLLASVAMLVALSGCQSKKEAVQLACDSPNRVDNSLPPNARGQALAMFIEQNVKNDEVLKLLSGDQPRMAKAEALEALAKGEGVESCELAKLWATPPLPPMWAMPPASGRPAMPPGSAMPALSAPVPIGSGRPPQTAVEVLGALDVAKITPVVDGATGAVSECYKAGLRRDKKLEGRVRVRFVIDATGKVKSAENAGSTLPDAEVVKCIAGAIGKLTFPKPEKGEVVVTYPFRLKLGT
jgi:TonB family protein